MGTRPRPRPSAATGAPQGAQTSGHNEPAGELTGMLDGYLHLIPPTSYPLAERGHNIRPERMHTIGETSIKQPMRTRRNGQC